MMSATARVNHVCECVPALRLPCADRLVVTEIDADVEGDAFFPPIDRTQWIETSRETHHSEANGFDYAFVTYERPPSDES